MRLLTMARGRESGLSGLIMKLEGCEISYESVGAGGRCARPARPAAQGRAGARRWHLAGHQHRFALGTRHRRRHRPDPEEHHRRGGLGLPREPRLAEATSPRTSSSGGFGLGWRADDAARHRGASAARARAARARARIAEGEDEGVGGLHRSLGAAGVTGLLVPEEQGGAGLGLLEAAVAAQELGPPPRRSASTRRACSLRCCSAAARSRTACRVARGAGLRRRARGGHARRGGPRHRGAPPRDRWERAGTAGRHGGAAVADAGIADALLSRPATRYATCPSARRGSPSRRC